MKQIYKITYYPTGKIYIGKDSIGSYRYYGSPDMDVVNNDFEMLPEKVRKDYMIRKQILWESESCSETELSIVPARKGREQSEESGFYFQTTLSPIRNISRYDNYRIILHMSCKAGKCKSGV